MIADHDLLTSSLINIKGFNCFMSWHLKKLQQKHISEFEKQKAIRNLEFAYTTYAIYLINKIYNSIIDSTIYFKALFQYLKIADPTRLDIQSNMQLY